jgi:hypothetical protein
VGHALPNLGNPPISFGGLQGVSESNPADFDKQAAVPEVAIDEDCEPCTGKGQIGLSWQVPVAAVTMPALPQFATQEAIGDVAAIPNRPHILRHDSGIARLVERLSCGHEVHFC